MNEENRTNADRSDTSPPVPRAWQAYPRPFASNVPLIGPLIAAFRQVWYNVAARWQDVLLFERLRYQEQRLEDLERWVRQSQEYTNHLLCERGLEIGILAEGLAQLKLEAKDEDRC